jgi:hypothetical protein
MFILVLLLARAAYLRKGLWAMPSSVNTNTSLPAMSYYSLENTVNELFSGCSVTKEKCNQIAAQLTGEPVEPVQLQGAFSYTVAASKLLVQFRAPESPLDPNTPDLARKIYGNVVPACVNGGVIGPAPSLKVYVMEKVPE